MVAVSLWLQNIVCVVDQFQKTNKDDIVISNVGE